MTVLTHSETTTTPRDTTDRFEFGQNWRRFLNTLTPEQITAAQQSLLFQWGSDFLTGKSLLDIGCGSGLFSLAATQLGARVTSFDFDPHSVACAEHLREHHQIEPERWQICRGSVLDSVFLETLGKFDVVYSWGVLHHTGAMWPAIELAAKRVAPGGRLWIALYNDQGTLSRVWWSIKRVYQSLPQLLRPLFVAAVGSVYYCSRVVGKLATKSLDVLLRLFAGKPPANWNTPQTPALASVHTRGMRLWTDLVDWVGGYPFEVARPDDVVTALWSEGFELETLRSCGGKLGCNEFVFHRRTMSPDT